MGFQLKLHLKRTEAGNLTIECSDPPGKGGGKPCPLTSHTAYIITIEGEGMLTNITSKSIKAVGASKKAQAALPRKAAKKATSDPPGKKAKKAKSDPPGK